MMSKLKSFTVACGIEIKFHVFVFTFVVFPLTALFFPCITIYWIVYAILGISANAGLINKKFPDFILANWSPFVLVSITLLLIYYCVRLSFELYYNNSAITNDRKALEIPANEKGLFLKNKLDQLWSDHGDTKSKPPNITWFVNFNVLARAIHRKGIQEIQISSGLWERIIKNDSLSNLILLHETAHLVHHDIPLFTFLNSVASLARHVIRVIFLISAIVSGISIIYELVSDINQSSNITTMLRHLFGVPFVAILVIVPMLMGNLILRRYGGFITSMLELRADVSASEWIVDFQNFYSALKNDLSIHQSSFSDLGHSLISLNLTHISEAERINILGSPFRLATPKLRYFALSIILVLLVPINSFTPMLWGGALDHFLMTVIITVLYLITSMMLFWSPLNNGLSFKRSFVLAFVLFFVIGLATVNTYSEGYFLTVLSASFFPPNGFADEPISWLEFKKDLSITLTDRLQQLLSSYGHWDVLLSLFIATLLIYFTSKLFVSSTPNKWLAIANISIVTYLVVVCCYDPFRSAWYDNWLLSFGAVIFDFTKKFPGLKYLIPIFPMFLISCICRIKGLKHIR